MLLGGVIQNVTTQLIRKEVSLIRFQVDDRSLLLTLEVIAVNIVIHFLLLTVDACSDELLLRRMEGVNDLDIAGCGVEEEILPKGLVCPFESDLQVKGIDDMLTASAELVGVARLCFRELG